VALPRRFWHQPPAHEAIAASPDGSRLYIVDAVRGIVSVMETASLEVVRTAGLELGAAEASHTVAQVSEDGGTLFVGIADGDTSMIRAIDTTRLEVTRSWSMPSPVSGLGPSSDGLRLYLAIGDRVEVVDAATGEPLEALPFTSSTPIVDVTTVAG
jgi:DNA-binding beta-propeller fold protein YncE